MLSRTLERADRFLEDSHYFVLILLTPNNWDFSGESRLIFDTTNHTPIALQRNEKEFRIQSTAGKWGREAFEKLKATNATGVIERYNKRTNSLRIKLAFKGSEQFSERETITCQTCAFTLIDPLSFSLQMQLIYYNDTNQPQVCDGSTKP